MNLDAFTLSALVDEFMDTLVGGKVQDSIDVDESGLGLEIYNNHRRHYLYMSADSTTPRVYVTTDKLRRGITQPKQIGLLFRRYVENGIVQHISQPPWERLIQIDVEGQEGEVSIVIEPMERRANILLLQNGVILDCMRRVGAADNRVRVSLPGRDYVPPPPQMGKLDPFNVTVDELETIFAQNEDPKRKAFQVLSSKLLGVSRLLATETVFRAHTDINIKPAAVDPDAVHEALQKLIAPLRNREWTPGVAESGGIVDAFSVYPLTYLEGWHAVESVSAAIAAYFGAPTGEDAYTAAKQPVFEEINEAKAKVGAKLASLQRSMTDESDREVLKQSGELILAYQYTLESGQTELRAYYEVDQPEVVIAIDPKMTPLENAQKYFDRYNRAKRALDDVPRLIKETANELAYLEQIEVDLQLASNWPEIDEVQQALVTRGYWRGKRVKRLGGGGQSAPIRVVTDDGFVIWAGRNSRQNEMVSFKKATGDDLWLHARDVPGAHVVIKNDGRRIPETVIAQAAGLAAYYSAKRSDGKVPVDVTRIKYVRKIKGAGPGMVTYRNETTQMAEPISEKSLA